MDTIQLMRDIDKRYQSLSGLDTRKMYSIFYSRIDPAQVMIIGINPGGDPDNWNPNILASTGFYENWEHEYVDCNYSIQEPMLPLLMEVFSVDEDGVRKIPKTNLAFRRSPNTDAFKNLHGMSLTLGQNEARPFLEEIIQNIDPGVVVLEGMTTFDTFKKKYCDSESVKNIHEPLVTTHRGSQVRIYQADEGMISCAKRRALLLGIGHPSIFGAKPEFPLAVKRMKATVSEYAQSGNRGSLTPSPHTTRYPPGMQAHRVRTGRFIKHSET